MSSLPPIPEKSCLGIDAKLTALLTYLLGFVSGVVFLVLEKDNKFVRFHAMQSTMIFAVLAVFQVTLTVIPWLGIVLGVYLLHPAVVILWLVLMVKAYQGKWYKLPIIGDLAEKQLG